MPVLAENKSVKGDERQEDGIFVHCEGDWRNQCCHCAHDGSEGVWTGGQLSSQHHHKACVLQKTNSWSYHLDLLI